MFMTILRIILDLLFIFYLAMWIIFPAYLSNAVVVPISNKYKQKFHRIDAGRKLGEYRILGDGKTIEGFLIGSIIGIIGGIIQFLLSPIFYQVSVAWYDFYIPILIPRSDVVFYLSFNLVVLTRTLFFPVGALLGDIIGSFIKRRLGKPRGEPLIIIDQLDLLLGVLLISLPLAPIHASFFQIDLPYLLTIVILTHFIHRIVNKLAFKLNVKNVAH